jgi:membrane protease YdiL (CAAX protease family)
MNDILSLVALLILYIPVVFTTLYVLKSAKLLTKIIYTLLSIILVNFITYIFLAVNLIILFILYKKGIIECNNDKLYKKININDTVLLTAIVVGIKIIFTLINMGYLYILNKLSIPIENQEIINQLASSTPGWFLYLSVIIVIFAPIAEEFCFRYFFYDKLFRNKFKVNRYISSILSAVLFSLLHANIAGALSFFMLGLILCYIYEKKGIMAGIIIHAEYNAFAVLSILFYQI